MQVLGERRFRAGCPAAKLPELRWSSATAQGCWIEWLAAWEVLKYVGYHLESDGGTPRKLISGLQAWGIKPKVKRGRLATVISITCPIGPADVFAQLFRSPLVGRRLTGLLGRTTWESASYLEGRIPAHTVRCCSNASRTEIHVMDQELGPGQMNGTA